MEFIPLIMLDWEPSPHAVSETVEVFDCERCHWFDNEGGSGVILGVGSNTWPDVFSWRVVSEYADGRTVASETRSIKFEMILDYLVHGEVSDAVTGEPVDGALVSWDDEYHQHSTETHNGGDFFARIHYDSKVAPPTTTITISVDGYESQQILGENTDGTDLIQLQPTTP